LFIIDKLVDVQKCENSLSTLPMLTLQVRDSMLQLFPSLLAQKNVTCGQYMPPLHAATRRCHLFTTACAYQLRHDRCLSQRRRQHANRNHALLNRGGAAAPAASVTQPAPLHHRMRQPAYT
jgi:hypothetical protein